MINLYQTAYDLINDYIFGSSAVSGSYEELICVLGGTALCAFAVALPFVIINKVLTFSSRW